MRFHWRRRCLMVAFCIVTISFFSQVVFSDPTIHSFDVSVDRIQPGDRFTVIVHASADVSRAGLILDFRPTLPVFFPVQLYFNGTHWKAITFFPHVDYPSDLDEFEITMKAVVFNTTGQAAVSQKKVILEKPNPDAPSFGLTGLISRNSTPIEEITVNAQSPPIRGIVPFTVHFSAEVWGTVTRFEWDFDGDGHSDHTQDIETTADSQTLPDATYTYARAGEYHPTLRVTDTLGKTYTATITVTAEPIRNSIVYLRYLKCNETEDLTGNDEIELRISVDGGSPHTLRRDMNTDDLWRFQNQEYSFGEGGRVVIQLWDLDDDVPEDDDDYLGKTTIISRGTSYRGYSAFKKDDADYELIYALDAGTDVRQRNAFKAWREFEPSTDSSPFERINKDQLIKEIGVRISDDSLDAAIDIPYGTKELATSGPFVTNQEDTPLCGPITILTELARNNPARYVYMARTLYETGRFGEIVPDPHIYTKPSPPGMAHVDWMLAASMRDYENDIVDYDYYDDDQAASITWPPEMEHWMETILGCGSAEWISTLAWGEFDALREAGRAVRAGHVAALLVDTDFWPGKLPPILSYPTHWILLLSVQRSSDGVAAFTVYSWGERYTITMDKERFEGLMEGVVIGYY